MKEIPQIRAIVVDDEKCTVDEISRLAIETCFIRIAGKFSDPVAATKMLKKLVPDIAFVDIEMPGMDGIELAGKILDQVPNVRIVFITGWNQYAVQAFELNALDYLMKPVSPERFTKMTERIKKEICEKRLGKNLEIRMFGKLEVIINGESVKWPRTKSAELFAYLLMYHGEYIHKDTIIEALWPDYKPEKALTILQTAVCKIRQVFAPLGEEVMLNYSGSRYCLVIRQAECDYMKAEQSIFNYKPDDIETFRAVEEACALFDKGFLSEQGYLWSIEKDEQLRNSFLRILREIGAAYSAHGNNNDRIEILKITAKMAPYDEEVNYTLIRELLKQQKFYELSEHCRWLDDTLKNDYDIVPSMQLQHLIKKYKK